MTANPNEKASKAKSLVLARQSAFERVFDERPECMESPGSSGSLDEVVADAQLFAEKLLTLVQLLRDSRKADDQVGLIVGTWGLQWFVCRSQLELRELCRWARNLVGPGDRENWLATHGARLSFKFDDEQDYAPAE